MKGRVILVGAGSLVVVICTLLVGVLGIPQLFFVAWVLLVTAVAVAFRGSADGAAEHWPPPAEEPWSSGSEVARLAWTIDRRTGRAGPAFTRRVHQQVQGRMRRHGFDIDDPAQHDRILTEFGLTPLATMQRRELARDEVQAALDFIEQVDACQTGGADTSARPQERNDNAIN